MALLTTYFAVVSVLNFIILWGGIHLLSRWIPPNAGDEMPIWKTGVIAAVITIFAMLFIGFITGIVTPEV